MSQRPGLTILYLYPVLFDSVAIYLFLVWFVVFCRFILSPELIGSRGTKLLFQCHTTKKQWQCLRLVNQTLGSDAQTLTIRPVARPSFNFLLMYVTIYFVIMTCAIYQGKDVHVASQNYRANTELTPSLIQEDL